MQNIQYNAEYSCNFNESMNFIFLTNLKRRSISRLFFSYPSRMMVSEQFISKLNCSVRLSSYGNVRNCELAFSLFLVLKKSSTVVSRIDGIERSKRKEKRSERGQGVIDRSKMERMEHSIEGIRRVKKTAMNVFV